MPKFWTRHGTAEDRRMRKLALDGVAETHRAGSRVILSDPKRYFGLDTCRLRGTREEIRRLDHAVRRLLKRAGKQLGRRRGGGGVETCRVQVAFYPLRAPDG